MCMFMHSVEWNNAKREVNILNVGVDFVRAADIFYGAVAEAEDLRADYGERRFRALGQVDGQSFVVV